MQRIIMTRSLYNELERCDRSFIMSLYYHNLDTDTLDGKEHDFESFDFTAEVQREMMMSLHEIRNMVDEYGITTIECTTDDIWETVRNTEDAIAQGGPAVLLGGALEAGYVIASFDIMLVHEDGSLSVYQLSSKSYDVKTARKEQNQAEKISQSYLPIMSVLAERFPDTYIEFCVLGANQAFMTPYADPETGRVELNADKVFHRFFFDDIELRDIVADADLLGHAYDLQAQVGANPRWIPEAEIGPQCGRGYPCPFKRFCEMQLNPDDVTFHMEYHLDRKHLKGAGLNTMAEVLEYSYENPTMTNINALDAWTPPMLNDDGTPISTTFDLSEQGMRDLRLYEDTL